MPALVATFPHSFRISGKSGEHHQETTSKRLKADEEAEWLKTIQIHRPNTDNTPAIFAKFRVEMLLNIVMNYRDHLIREQEMVLH